MVSCDVWRALSTANIAVCLLPGRGPGNPVYMGQGLATGTLHRRQQFYCYEDPERRLFVAQQLLQRKIEAYDHAIVLIANRLAGITGNSQQSLIDQWMSLRERMDAGVSTARSIDTLRGHEGAASRDWFGLIRQCIDPIWSFTNRNRRPPKDPLNALLSFCYTLILSHAKRAVYLAGFDSRLGFMHAPRSARPALALDIIESARPACDAFAIDLLHQYLTQNDFHIDQQGACSLGKQARSTFFSHWTAYLDHWPQFSGSLDNIPTDTIPEPVYGSLENFMQSNVAQLKRDIGEMAAVQAHFDIENNEDAYHA